MATTIIYGSSLAAVDDLPDPAVEVDEELNAAYACLRRLMQDDDALEEIGETEHYASVNTRNWLGGSYDFSDPTVVDGLASQATQALQEEPFAAGVIVALSFADGALTLTALVDGRVELFQLVLQNGAEGVDAQLLLPGREPINV